MHTCQALKQSRVALSHRSNCPSMYMPRILAKLNVLQAHPAAASGFIYLLTPGEGFFFASVSAAILGFFLRDLRRL